MKKSTILIGLMVVVISVVAQESNSFVFELGKPNLYELTMTEYKSDKSADAIVIYESGDFYFRRIDRQEKKDFYFSLVKVYKMKIKILKESGMERAKFAIPVFNGNVYMWDKFTIQSVNVYNYDTINKKIEKKNFKDKESIIGGKFINDNDLNSNYTIKNFALNDVSVGSIIELEYAIETPFIFSFQWQFQKNIPIVYSKLRYQTTPFLIYVYQLNNDKKFDEYYEEYLKAQSKTANEKSYVFGMKNIPAFKNNKENDVLTINFQLNEQRNPYTMTNYDVVPIWQTYSNEIIGYDDFGKYIKQAEKEAKNILSSLNLSGMSQQEAMKTILNYVKTNYNWNGYYGKYVLNKVSDFIKDKNGNAANINLFLIGLLNTAKIPATPVLISQYNNSVKSYPFDAYFNYVIARVTINNTTYYFDAADFIKKTDLTGFVVKKNSNEFVKIEKIEPNTINNFKPEQEKFDNDSEFVTLLNSFKKVFYFYFYQ